MFFHAPARLSLAGEKAQRKSNERACTFASLREIFSLSGNDPKKTMKLSSQPLLLPRQVLHDQLLLNLPRVGIQQG
jgi:hypothetical protein